MKRTKHAKLKRRGWAVGTAADLLALTPEEAAFVEIKLALSDALRARRRQAQLSQAHVAKQIGSSQSRVAKMEAGDPSVTLDLLVRALLALGATKRTVARTIEAARLRRWPSATWGQPRPRVRSGPFRPFDTGHGREAAYPHREGSARGARSHSRVLPQLTK